MPWINHSFTFPPPANAAQSIPDVGRDGSRGRFCRCAEQRTFLKRELSKQRGRWVVPDFWVYETQWIR